MGIPVVLKPVVVPVPLTVIVAVEIEDIAVAVRVEQKYAKCRPYRRSLISQKAGIKVFGIIMP